LARENVRVEKKRRLYSRGQKKMAGQMRGHLQGKETAEEEWGPLGQKYGGRGTGR